MLIKTNPKYCKGCNLCVVVCPNKVFEKGSEISERGYILPQVKHPERCPNFRRKTKRNAVCEMCILTCPDQALFWDEEVSR